VFEPQRFYTPDEVRRESRGPRALVYEALRSGELQAIRRGRRWLIPGSAVLDWIDNLTDGNGGVKP